MFNAVNRPPLYDQQAVQYMRDELISVGFKELLTTDQVDAAVNQNNDQTTLIVINSVCGCAAGSARPGVALSLQNNIIPDYLYTVFAGQEREAVDRVRSYIKGYPPSSPSAAIFKNGELIFYLPRFEIEGREFNAVANLLVSAYENYCTGKGPSISAEEFNRLDHLKMCGSKIPLNGK